MKCLPLQCRIFWVYHFKPIASFLNKALCQTATFGPFGTSEPQLVRPSQFLARTPATEFATTRQLFWTTRQLFWSTRQQFWTTRRQHWKNRQRQTFLPLDRPCVIHNITLTMAAQNISTLITTINMNIYPFIKNNWLLVKRDIFRRSPHNSLDSSDSGKSVKLAEDSDGFTLARASDHCKTFWLSKRNKHLVIRAKCPKKDK